MSWLQPLAAPVTRNPRQSQPRRNRREVTVGGRTYSNMAEACRKIGCSTTKLYGMFKTGEAR